MGIINRLIILIITLFFSQYSYANGLQEIAYSIMNYISWIPIVVGFIKILGHFQQNGGSWSFEYVLRTVVFASCFTIILYSPKQVHQFAQEEGSKIINRNRHFQNSR